MFALTFSTASSEISTAVTSDAPAAASLLTHVRVVRNRIGHIPINSDDVVYLRGNGATSYCAVLLDCYFDLSVRSVMTEADFIATDGRNDLDWASINMAYNGLYTPTMTMVRAEYRIVIGDDDVGEYEFDGNNLPIFFTNVCATIE